MALIRNGKISILGFLSGGAIVLVPLMTVFGRTLLFLWEDFWFFILLLYSIIYNGVLIFICRTSKDDYQVAVRAGFLGTVFGLGCLLSLSDSSFIIFGWYIMALSFFHFSEYFTTAATNPKSLTLESFLLNHSREYKFAALASWIEFLLEWYIAPGLKQFFYVSLIGLSLVIFGEVLRKASMITAQTNFNHYVQHIKKNGHVLVTNGVYSFFRHPSYVGWFYWSIGTQVILCNPLCCIVYIVASWRFFRERIYEEEIYLLNFFGEDYFDYQKRVGTGLPFIKGYQGQL